MVSATFNISAVFNAASPEDGDVEEAKTGASFKKWLL